MSAGKAAIGGPFELVDGNGSKVTDKDLLGQFALIYFGFTYCPDICPDELEKMAKVIDSLGTHLHLLCVTYSSCCHVNACGTVAEKGGQTVRPVFISIDPERDSPQQVKQYIKEFHPKMLGLTGSVEQVCSGLHIGSCFECQGRVSHVCKPVAYYHVHAVAKIRLMECILLAADVGVAQSQRVPSFF